MKNQPTDSTKNRKRSGLDSIEALSIPTRTLYTKETFARGERFLFIFLFFSFARPGGSVVSVSDSCLSGCEFEPRSGRTFFPGYFCLSSPQRYVRKVISGFGRRSCVGTGVKKPGNTPTAMI